MVSLPRLIRRGRTPFGQEVGHDLDLVRLEERRNVAAFIEAFWSSIAWVPTWGKFTASAVLWALVIIWLWRGGHGGHDAG